MTEQLKPCPFCGGINVIHSGYRMYCHACGAEGPDADSADESAAIAAWNRRAQPAQAGAEPVYQVSMKSGPANTAWVDCDEGTYNSARLLPSEYAVRKLYTHPPARVPLTDEEIVAVRKSQVGRYGSVDPAKPYSDSIAFARTIEASHGIGGGK